MTNTLFGVLTLISLLFVWFLIVLDIKKTMCEIENNVYKCGLVFYYTPADSEEER